MAAQQAGIDGQNNIIVQIEGDNNAVNLKGLGHLSLTRYLTRRHIETDVDLLSPYSRSIPLIGREAELAELRAWLTTGKPISIRVLTGRAGSGKTRLALELCEQLLGEGWDAGFLESGELERFRAAQNLASWGWQRPTLIVSDYAAVHADRLNGWFQELADNQGDPGKPLRLLLLERSAETAGGWWQTAFGRGGFGARAVQRLLDPGEPIPLMPMVASNDRRSVIGETLERAESAERPPEEGADPAFDRQLAELTWGGEPLFLMMAGLMAKDAGMGRVLSLRRTDLAFALAERELARIARIGEANEVEPDFMEVMAAYVTLCRGLDAAQIRAAVAAEQAALGLPGAGDPGTVAKLLRVALPGANGADPILPDMIGEAAIVKTLPQHYEDSSAGAVVRAFKEAGNQVAATVIRTAQDFAGAGHLEPLAWLDALIEDGLVDANQLILIADELPQTSLALQRHAATIAAALVEILEEEVTREDSGFGLPVLAGALSNLGVRLGAIGQREEALAPAQEAADLYRALAAEAPDVYRPALANALNNLATSFGEVGQRQEALTTAQEAADLYCALAAEAPDVWRPELAMALNNLAIRLSAVGQRQAALAPAQEAVAIRRELAAEAPDIWQPALATALNNLGIRLSEVGQRQAALAPAQEAVVIRRELAAKAPDAYRPDLASALNNLAVFLSRVDQRQEALAPAQEAADLYRELAAKAPDAYRPDLAMALNNLAIRRSDIGQRQAALGPAREAVAIRRELAAMAPATYRPDLAKSLNTLANHLIALGQPQEALKPAQEAIAIRRELAATAPDSWRSDLAASLSTLASCLSEVGQREAALAPAQEAVAIRRALAAETPDAYEAALASALDNLATSLSEVGEREEAVAPAQEAVAIWRELAAKAPDTYRPNLAMALDDLATSSSEVGQREEALAAAEEAVAIWRELAAKAPDAYRQDLALSLSLMADRLEELDRTVEAVGADEEALGAMTPYFAAHPQASAHDMAPIARDYLRRCKKLDREPDKVVLGPVLEVVQRMPQRSAEMSRSSPGSADDRDHPGGTDAGYR